MVHVVGTKSHCLDSKIQPYGLIFRPQVEENKCDNLFFLYNLFRCLNQEKRCIFVSKTSLTEKTPNKKDPGDSSLNPFIKNMGETQVFWNPHKSGYPMEPITDNVYFNQAIRKVQKTKKIAKTVILKGGNSLDILI